MCTETPIWNVFGYEEDLDVVIILSISFDAVSQKADQIWVPELSKHIQPKLKISNRKFLWYKQGPYGNLNPILQPPSVKLQNILRRLKYMVEEDSK